MIYKVGGQSVTSATFCWHATGTLSENPAPEIHQKNGTLQVVSAPTQFYPADFDT